VLAGAAGTGVRGLAAPAAASEVVGSVAGGSLGCGWLAGAIGKLPRVLFTTLGLAGRCGALEHAASASSVRASSKRGGRLIGGVAKFRTL
jgi:hypothetical protein